MALAMGGICVLHLKLVKTLQSSLSILRQENRWFFRPADELAFFKIMFQHNIESSIIVLFTIHVFLAPIFFIRLNFGVGFKSIFSLLISINIA